VSRVPPHSSGGLPPPENDELDHLEELGDDAIIAQQQAPHAPKPRVHVTEEARSIVISEPPPRAAPHGGAGAASGKRKARGDKTVVIRDRRQLDELRREMAKRSALGAKKSASKGVLVWACLGVAAFLLGGLVALLATQERQDQRPAKAAPSAAPQAAPARKPEAAPRAVSIDELPVEDKN